MSSVASPRLHICHAPDDNGWVRGCMLPALGLAEGQCRTRADDTLGAAQLAEIERAIDECRLTVLIASSAARRDMLVQHAATLAQHVGVEDGRPRLVILTRDFSPGSEAARALLPCSQRALVNLDCSDEASTAGSLAQLRALLDLDEPIESHPASPYPGLAPLTAADRHLLFGRDRDRDSLLQRIRGRHTRILVLGPSGAGKSSLVQAAVVPALRRVEHVVEIVPRSDDPLVALRAAVDHIEIPGLVAALDAYADLAGETGDAGIDQARARLRATTAPDGRRRVVVIDPLEQIFDLDERARTTLLCMLGGLWSLPWCTVILCLRADFCDALRAERCWRELEGCQYELLPLDEAGLREAITGPARRADVHVEAALVERLVRELDADRSSSPLPLLQLALCALWPHLRWRYLSLEGYARHAPEGAPALGGALAVHAAGVLQALDAPGDREIARRILIDLVHLGEGRPHTRRRRTLGELRRAGDAPGQLERVLDALIEGRLIVAGPSPRDHAEAPREARSFDLIHDALIGGWSELAAWVTAHRGDLLEQRRLEARAQAWRDSGRARGLLDEGDTDRARAWTDSAAGKLLGASPALVELIEASVEAHAHARRTREEQAQTIARLAATLRKTRATVATALEAAEQALSQLDAELRAHGARAEHASRASAQARPRHERDDLRPREALDATEAERPKRPIEHAPVAAAARLRPGP